MPLRTWRKVTYDTRQDLMNQKIEPKVDTPPAREKVYRTQVALRAALLELLEELPFEQIKVRDITTRAGVGYATFFRRYSDKEHLLDDLAADEIRKLMTMTLPLFYTVDTIASNQALCAYVWEHRKVWKALLTGGAAASLKEEYLRQALELAKVSPDPNAWLPDDLAVTFAVTAILEMLAWWLKSSSPPSVKEMAAIIDRLAVTPLFPPPLR